MEIRTCCWSLKRGDPWSLELKRGVCKFFFTTSLHIYVKFFLKPTYVCVNREKVKTLNMFLYLL